MYRYSIAVRMRTGSLCACALGTRVQYNLLQFIWALQSSSTELPAIAQLGELSRAKF